MTVPSQQQFRGCLIGQCLADALGFVREGFPREDCEAFVAGRLRAWLDGADEDFDGQYTDDSQLARELIQSFVERKGFEPADFARRVAAIFVEDRIVGRGMATHHAAMRIAEGVPWDRAGTPSPSAGNGSAMRAAPIGLWFSDPAEMVDAARDQARITHLDPRSTAGAVAVAGATHLSARSPQIDVASFAAQLAAWCGPIDTEFASLVGRLPELIGGSFEKAVDTIASLGLAPGETSDWDRISPFVVPSVMWSLYSFLRTPDDYAEAVCTAIRVGGDVDTTAAMTGAIAGAHLGIDALPPHLAVRVHDRDSWGHADLVDLADQCHRVASHDSPTR